jgi:outer membrane protein insertion porin family
MVEPHAEIFHDPDRATLTFVVTPGPRALIGSIDVVGSPVVPRGELLERLGVSEGSAYRRDVLDERVERYVAERRKAGYYETRVTVDAMPADDDRKVNLRLTVAPGPRIRLRFTGDPLPPEKRTDLVPIEREGSVDEDLLEDSTNRIEDYLRAQGYRDAAAPHRREESGGELVVTFDVRRGPAYRVGRVEVTGNASVPLADLDPLLRLREGLPFTEAALTEDVARINDFYQRRGFAGVAVRSAVEASSDVSAGSGSVVVRMVIAEGPRALVGRVRTVGNATVTEATLLRGLRLQQGQPYYRAQLVVDRESLQTKYLNLGYPGATVEASADFNADRTQVDPIFTVSEGPRILVGHVLIVGNVRTSADTISRELTLKPGDPLSVAARLESQQRLAALGLFRRIQISELSHGDEHTRDLIVTVEEAPTVTVSYGGGFEVRLRVVPSAENPEVASQLLQFAPRGSFQIGRRNFYGKNRSVNLFTSLALYPSSFLAGQSAPPSGGGSAIAEYRVVGQYREPRLFETAADASITATVEQQIRSSFNFYRRALSADLARSLTGTIKVQGGYQIDNTRLFDVSVTPDEQHVIDRLFPQIRLASFTGSVVNDTRDDVADPGSGRYLSVSSQLAAQSIGSEVGFIQGFFTASSYRTLPIKARRIVLAGNARLGLAAGFPRVVQVTNPDGSVSQQTVEDLPQAERFFAGGDSTVRGFAPDSLGTPATIDSGGFPIGGTGLMIFNAEVRAQVQGPVTAVGFFDTGNVWVQPSDIRFSELRSAVGFGVRYKSPVGPIRVDLGFKVHREVVAGQLEGLTALHLSFGQTF